VVPSLYGRELQIWQIYRSSAQNWFVAKNNKNKNNKNKNNKNKNNKNNKNNNKIIIIKIIIKTERWKGLTSK